MSWNCPKKKKETKVITLNEEELEKIRQTQTSDRLKAAKDWLLISCYTGQRISDFMNFSTAMIEKVKEKDCLFFTQQKTNKDILLPIHPEVHSIIKKNKFRFPKKLPIHTYNLHIKEIVRLAGIYTSIVSNKREGHRAPTQVIPKWKAISSHIGRRSFASNFYGKIPTPLLMEATGHSTEQMFQKYIKAFDASRVLALSSYFEAIYQQKKLL